MNLHSSSLRAVAVAALLALWAGPALAQYTGYDANCDPRNYTSDEQLQQELCMAHLGCRLTTKAATSACKVKDFFSSLGGLLGGRSKPDNVDILEALNRTEVPQTSGVKQTNAAARPYYQGSRVPSYDRTNAAQVDWQQAFYGPPKDSTAPSGYLNRSSGGAVQWFEGVGSLNGNGQRSGTGTVIDAKGDIKAGSLINENLNGAGVRRASDGSWAGGNFDSGGLNGKGYTLVPETSGRSPVMEGTYVNGQPDGMMLVTWPDLSSRKELWRSGKFLSAGPTVPKGQVPSDPKTPEQEAADKAAAEEAAFNAALNRETSAGGLYAMGDEWAEKGDMAKAKAAWREMIRRYPDSPLVAGAASRLGNAQSGSSSGRGGAPSSALTSGDVEECDFDSYHRENQANDDYYMQKTQDAASGAYGGSRDIYKYMYLKNKKSLEIIDRHKTCNKPEVYNEWRKYYEDTMNVALQNCMATSSDGGQGCTQE